MSVESIESVTHTHTHKENARSTSVGNFEMKMGVRVIKDCTPRKRRRCFGELHDGRLPYHPARPPGTVEQAPPSMSGHLYVALATAAMLAPQPVLNFRSSCPARAAPMARLDLLPQDWTLWRSPTPLSNLSAAEERLGLTLTTLVRKTSLHTATRRGR